MGLIADEQPALAHVPKTEGKAQTVVEGLILAYAAGLTRRNFDGPVHTSG